MPHSSGGGSSSGGSHGGSHSRSGGGGSSNTRFGSNYYPGAHRYVYYVNRPPRYYFSDTSYTIKDAKNKKRSDLFGGIIWALVSLVFFFGALSEIHIPKKVVIDYDTGIVIEDHLDILDEADRSEMDRVFSQFREDTGVTPSFIAVSDTQWQDRTDTLELYAYRSYVENFDDEKHWLVVYAEGGGKWAWEGMLGDDCEDMITPEMEDEFTKTIQENLWADTRYSVAGAICNGFEGIAKKAQKVQFDFTDVVILLLAAASVCFGIFMILGSLRQKPEDDPRLRSERCRVDKENPREDVCDYCGGVYVHGVHTSCPHCGAPVRIEMNTAQN